MIILSDDPARLDIPRIHGWLASSYWSPGIALDRVERAIANSHGIARMITDFATFAWLADVWVDAPARGQGLGRRMVRWFLDDPRYEGLRRVGLTTLDAHGVYAPLGFHAPLRPERYMEKLDPAFANHIGVQDAGSDA
jgi:GNAT superfamily N-acetyltransferase